MAKKSRKRVHRRHVAKQSLFDKLFTFPKVVVYAFVILSVVTLYQISLPGTDVKGASTVESTFKYKLKMIVYKDKNPADAIRQNDESCLAKTFRVKIKDKDGNVRQVTATGSSDCKTFAIPVPSTTKGYCNTVTFVNDLANWTITGIQSDSANNGKPLLGQSSAKVCVYPPSEGLSVAPYAIINFGLKPR